MWRKIQLQHHKKLDGKLLSNITMNAVYVRAASVTATNNNQWFWYSFQQKINFELLWPLLFIGVLRNLIIQYILQIDSQPLKMVPYGFQWNWFYGQN